MSCFWLSGFSNSDAGARVIIIIIIIIVVQAQEVICSAQRPYPAGN